MIVSIEPEHAITDNRIAKNRKFSENSRGMRCTYSRESTNRQLADSVDQPGNAEVPNTLLS